MVESAARCRSLRVMPGACAMATAAYECTFGTFIRLEFDKVYDGMLAAPLSVADVVMGEAIWAGTKGAFFSFAVLVIISSFGIVHFFTALLTPVVGFLSGFLFAAIALLVTGYVKNINQFNFYFTGLLSPMFMFCGTIFPISNLPKSLQIVAEFLPPPPPWRFCARRSPRSASTTPTRKTIPTTPTCANAST